MLLQHSGQRGPTDTVMCMEYCDGGLSCCSPNKKQQQRLLLLLLMHTRAHASVPICPFVRTFFSSCYRYA